MSLQSVRAFLAEHAPDIEILEATTSTATVALAAEAHGVTPAEIAKTLSLRLNGEPILLVMSGEARLDNRKYKDRFGAKAKMLDAEEVLAATSHPVGGVCPIGLPRPLRVYADVSLRRFAVVVPAAGDTHHAMRIAPERLVRARGGRVGRRGAGAEPAERASPQGPSGVSSPPPGRLTRPTARTRSRRAWMRWLPGLRTLLQYERAWLRHDLVAGLVLTAVLVPVGIAYAVAAGVPAIAGLYATIFGLLAYALFGPSRVLVLGPDSALVALILGVVLPLSGGDPQRAVALAAMMALVSGTVCVLAGIARLGFVTELLSKPIRYGYMNGIALTVLVSQLPALFGFSGGGDALLGESRAFVDGLRAAG